MLEWFRQTRERKCVLAPFRWKKELLLTWNYWTREPDQEQELFSFKLRENSGKSASDPGLPENLKDANLICLFGKLMVIIYKSEWWAPSLNQCSRQGKSGEKS